MAAWEDVRRMALGMPEATEELLRGFPSWRIRSKLFVWERPLHKADLLELGTRAPAGPVLGARVPDLGVKDALVFGEPDIYFTTAHFRGNPAVLVRLEAIPLPDLQELIAEAWLARAPKRLAEAYGMTLGSVRLPPGSTHRRTLPKRRAGESYFSQGIRRTSGSELHHRPRPQV